MKKKIKLSIISTLLLTSTLAITLPIVSCSGSINPNTPIYTIDAAKFDSNKIVKINKVISAIVNDPNSTTQQKMTRYRNLNTYANNSELLKSVNDYFFLIDKNNNDSVIKNSIESLEIIPTNNPTLTFDQTMPKVTIKINIKPEFKKYMENDNISSYSFDTGTLDRLGFVNLRMQFDVNAWRNYIMNYIGTNPGSNLTFKQQQDRITSSGNFIITWSREGSLPPLEHFEGLWDVFKNFFSVYIESSLDPIDQNLPFVSISTNLENPPGQAGKALFFVCQITPKGVGVLGNINRYNVEQINSVSTGVNNGELVGIKSDVNFGFFANA